MGFMCSKGGGFAIAPPAATYNQPPPATPIPGGNKAEGTMATVTATKVKASGSAALNASSKISPSQDLGSPGIGGTISGMIMGPMSFVTCSSTKVKIEGAAAARMGDMTDHNQGNCKVGRWTTPSQTKVTVSG